MSIKILNTLQMRSASIKVNEKIFVPLLKAIVCRVVLEVF